MKARWANLASDEDAHYDDVVDFDASDIEPTVAGCYPSTGNWRRGEFQPQIPVELDQELVTSALDYMTSRRCTD